MEETLHFEIDPEELEIFLEDVNGHLRTLEAGILGPGWRHAARKGWRC